MYGNYATGGPPEGEEHSQSSLYLSTLLSGSTKKYERRMGRTGSGTGLELKPVRMGQSVRKSAAAPRRMLMAGTGGAPKLPPDLSRQLSDIADEELGKGDNQEDASDEARTLDLSLSGAFESSLRISSSRQRPPVTTSKVSPDSGSFSMSITEAADGHLETDFTDNLPGSKVRLVPEPVRIVQQARQTNKENQPYIRRVEEDENQPYTRRLQEENQPYIRRVQEENQPYIRRVQEEENQPYIRRVQEENQPYTRRVQEERPVKPVQDISKLRERLQQLSGSNSNTDPVPNLARSTAAPVMPQRHPPMTQALTRPVLNPLPTPVLTPQPTHDTPSLGARSKASHSQPPEQPRYVLQTPQQTMPPPTTESREQVLEVGGMSYRIMKLLGKGGSSRVYEAFDERRSMVVAIKRVDLAEADEAQTAGFINEINMLSRLQGEDRIVTLFDHETVEKEEVLYVVMEKGDTDLASLLKKYSSRKELSPAMIKHYWTEMLHAVKIIHQHGIIHKDLKPANFLLVAGRLKLIDFGIASAVQSDKTSVTIDNQAGTFNFMSPESIQDLNGPQFDHSGARKPCIKISVKSDVWSLGCILYQLIYGKLPFGDIKHPIMKMQAIINKDHTIPFPPLDDEDPLLVSLIQSCLVRDPRGRPGISDLLQHPYVTGEQAKQEPLVKKKLDAVSAVQCLAALEGIMSPGSLNKTRQGLMAALQQEQGQGKKEFESLKQYKL